MIENRKIASLTPVRSFLKVLSEIIGISPSALSRRHDAARRKLGDNANTSKLASKIIDKYLHSDHAKKYRIFYGSQPRRSSNAAKPSSWTVLFTKLLDDRI